MSMNRKTVLVLALSFLLVSAFGLTALAAGDGVQVIVNDQKVGFPDEKPFLDAETGRTFVPLRFVSEALDGNVAWDADNKTAVIEKADTIIEMKIGSADPKVDGQVKSLDAPARLMNGRTMVPLRFISECFGANVQWDGPSKTVNISDNASGEVPDVEVPVIEVPDNNENESVVDDVYGDQFAAPEIK